MVQGEWNTLKMGKSSYATECKLVRFKTIYIESLESSETVPLMTDGVINVSSKHMHHHLGKEPNSVNLFFFIFSPTWTQC